MPVWLEISVLVLLALIVVELFGIEGNVGSVAKDLGRLRSDVSTAFHVEEIQRAKIRHEFNLSPPKS